MLGRDGLETLKLEIETRLRHYLARPRRDRDVAPSVRDETRDLESRDRDETPIGLETETSRYTAHTVQCCRNVIVITKWLTDEVQHN